MIISHQNLSVNFTKAFIPKKKEGGIIMTDISTNSLQYQHQQSVLWQNSTLIATCCHFLNVHLAYMISTSVLFHLEGC